VPPCLPARRLGACVHGGVWCGFARLCLGGLSQVRFGRECCRMRWHLLPLPTYRSTRAEGGAPNRSSLCVHADARFFVEISCTLGNRGPWLRDGPACTGLPCSSRNYNPIQSSVVRLTSSDLFGSVRPDRLPLICLVLVLATVGVVHDGLACLGLPCSSQSYSSIGMVRLASSDLFVSCD
jgi:hypothetical protein